MAGKVRVGSNPILRSPKSWQWGIAGDPPIGCKLQIPWRNIFEVGWDVAKFIPRCDSSPFGWIDRSYQSDRREHREIISHKQNHFGVRGSGNSSGPESVYVLESYLIFKKIQVAASTLSQQDRAFTNRKVSGHLSGCV